MIKISASLMCADYSNLAGQVEDLEKARVDMLHFDIMDGDFVPNFSMSQLEMKALRPLTKLTFDVHLMIKEPIRYIKQFADAGADILTVHAEACVHLDRTLQEIKEHGKKAAVALNPSTPLSAIQHVLDKLDMIVLMTVNPGFAGQKYIPSVIPKIKELRELLEKKTLNKDIQVDGNIGPETIKLMAGNGANVFVGGSSGIFVKGKSFEDNVRILKKAAENGYNSLNTI
tara:strand:- start:40 stop:726 length:687 start_codon:yes stop_codon:yes gene_type:complete